MILQPFPSLQWVLEERFPLGFCSLVPNCLDVFRSFYCHALWAIQTCWIDSVKDLYVLKVHLFCCLKLWRLGHPADEGMEDNSNAINWPSCLFTDWSCQRELRKCVIKQFNVLLWNRIALTMNLPFLFLQSLLSLGKLFLSFCSKWRHFNFLNRSFSDMGEESFVMKILLCCVMTILSAETQRGQIIFNWWFLFQCSPDFEWKSNCTEWHLSLGQVCSLSILLLDLCHLTQPIGCRSLCDEPFLSVNDDFVSLNSSTPPSNNAISFLDSLLRLYFSFKLHLWLWSTLSHSPFT